MNSTIADLIGQFDAVDADATALIASLSNEQAAWKPSPRRWSVLQCMEHTSVSARSI